MDVERIRPKRFAKAISDTVPINFDSLFPAWAPETTYEAKDIVSHGTDETGKMLLFKVIQGHTSQADQPPGSTPALYRNLRDKGGSVNV